MLQVRDSQFHLHSEVASWELQIALARLLARLLYSQEKGLVVANKSIMPVIHPWFYCCMGG